MSFINCTFVCDSRQIDGVEIVQAINASACLVSHKHEHALIMTESTLHNNQRIAKNTLALSARMFLTIAVGIYSSRLILEAVGVVDYGIYSVVGGVVTFFVFINASLVNAAQRFLNFYMGKGDDVMLRRVFATSRYIFALLALLIFVLGEIVGVVFVNYVLDIPESRLLAANIVCQLTIVAAVIDVLSLPYNALIISYERMVVFAYISVVQSLAVLATAFVLLAWGGDRLVAYAVSLCLIQVGVRVYYGYFCKKHFSILMTREPRDKSLLVEMLGFSGWSLTGAFAYVAHTQGIPILFNLFFGPVVNAANALVQQINASLSTFGANFMMAAKPQITKYYAEENRGAMAQLVYYSSKLSVGIMLMVSLPFLIMPDYLLGIWLVEVPATTSALLQMMLWATLVNALAAPVNTAIQATGTVKRYQVAEAITLLLVLPVVLIVLYMGAAPQSAYLVLAIVFGMTQMVRVFFLHRMVGVSYRDYITKVLTGAVVLTAASYVIVSVIHLYIGDSLLGLVAVVLAIALVVPALFLLVCVNRQERSRLFTMIADRFNHNKEGGR